MPTKPNDVEEDATWMRSSVMIPAWMEREIAEIAARTFSSRAQVIRGLLDEALSARRERLEAAS